MAKLKFDLITIGDATWDLFMKIHDAETRCLKDHKECILGLDYGGKIAVDQLHSSVGGNAANVAVACAKLDIKTAFVGFIGKDDAGKKALKIIEKAKVDTKYTILEGLTNQSAIISFQGERTILSYKEPRSYNLVKVPTSEWIFFTSTGPGSEKAISTILKKIEKRKIIFNPGSFHMKLGPGFIKKVIKKSFCLIVNLEEAWEILEKKPDDIRECLFDLVSLGPKIAVITNGKEGAYATKEERYYKIPSLKVKVADPTGAGDSFSAAFATALIYDKDIPDALRWGIANSTSLIQKLGTEEGLLTKNQIEKKLKDVKLEVIEF